MKKDLTKNEFESQLRELLSMYSLNWDCGATMEQISRFFLYAEDALQDDFKEEREVLTMWNFLRSVEDGDVQLKGCVKNGLGGNLRNYSVQIDIGLGWLMDSCLANKVNWICARRAIDPLDYNAVEEYIDLINYYTSANKEQREVEENRKLRDGKGITAWELMGYLNSHPDTKGWTGARKYCFIHDLMSDYGIINRRVEYGIYEGSGVRDGVKTIERWVKKIDQKPPYIDEDVSWD